MESKAADKGKGKGKSPSAAKAADKGKGKPPGAAQHTLTPNSPKAPKSPKVWFDKAPDQVVEPAESEEEPVTDIEADEAAPVDESDAKASKIAELKLDELAYTTVITALKSKTGKVAEETRKVNHENVKATLLQTHALRPVAQRVRTLKVAVKNRTKGLEAKQHEMEAAKIELEQLITFVEKLAGERAQADLGLKEVQDQLENAELEREYDSVTKNAAKSEELADLIVGCDEATIEACKALMAEPKAKKAVAPMEADLAGVKANPADPPVVSTAHTHTTGHTATADATVVPPVVSGVDANKPAVASVSAAPVSSTRGPCICGTCGSGTGGACGSCISGSCGSCSCTC